ncbi:hypothetical protein DY000_02046450 [Brassica cretica]|uniref:Uncharacterized protein n=1 Tax=Brassica cretica TaxID=69181 RepID=A0ABQ7EVB2_BRACR|nr:hypothetical protein DY000_02046450 [Brassica cretica]
MTHEEFTERHPHPPSPFYVKIDRPHEPAVDRQRETDIDRPPSPPIDRRAPLTYRVRLPSIDSDRINALRPPPKPLANPPEPTTKPSDTTPDPMQVDEATEGRRLRKRKETIPKNLKREAKEKEMDESINTHIASSIDSNESPTTDEHYPTSLDGKQPVDHFTLPDQCYPDFVFQQPIKRGRNDYSIGSWADNEFHESFAVDTDDRYSSHSFNNKSPPWIDRVYSASVDTHPHPAKQSYASIDTIPGTSIDIKAAAFEKEKGNIPIPSRFTNTYIRSFTPQITSHDTEAGKMNAPTNQSEGTSRNSIKSRNPNSADKRLPSIDTPVSTDSDSQPRAMDGRILQVSREDISDILQLANGPDNLVMQQRSIPDYIPAVPDEYPRANTTEIVHTNRADELAKHRLTRRYKFGHRAYDIYRARKFIWEQKDEYGVFRDEFGYARSVAGEMIHVTKDNIRKILERASLFEESHLCLPEHATSFTPTKLAPDIYIKDEINEMVTGICGAQEKLGGELKTLVDDTYQPFDRGYNELFRSMSEMRTEIEKPESLAEKKDEWEIAYINTRINDVYNPLNNNVDWLSTRIDLLQQHLDTIRKKDPQPVTSIDICTITSIDSKFAAMEDRLESYEDMHDRFTSPIKRYLDTLSTQMMNVQRDIGKLNDQHDFQEEGSTSIDRFRTESLDGKKPTEHLPYTAAEVDQITSKLYLTIDTMEERFEKRCDDIYFSFDVRLSGLESQAEWLQKEVKAI